MSVGFKGGSMKFFNFMKHRFLLLGVIIIGSGGLFLSQHIQANIFGDIAGAFGGKDAKKKVDKATNKAKKDVEKGVEKGIKDVGKVTDKALKELSKLGLPTDPQKLISFALSKLPQKELEKLASKILNIVLAQCSDLSKIAQTIMQPIDAIMTPIPPIPLFGIPIPGLPAAVSSIVDILCDFTLANCIFRTQHETFAYLKAFHSLTNNKYINADEKKLIKSKEDFDKSKGAIGKTVDLNKLRGVSGLVANHIRKIAGPLTQLVEFLEVQAAPLTKPFEQMAQELRPIPLALFIPVAGPIYNRVVFVFNLKDITSKFDDGKATMLNGLRPVVKQKPLLGALTSVTDLEKNPITKNCMKILRTLKAPADKSLEKIDEMFVDPLSKLPWGSQAILSLTLTVLNLMGGGVDGIIKEVIEVIAGVISGGAALTVTGILTKFINVKMINEFISETFYWSYIRYLKNRIARIDEVIKKAQADGVIIDGNALKQAAEDVYEYKENYQKSGSSKKASKGKAGKKDKKNKQNKKDKKQNAQSETGNAIIKKPAISLIPAAAPQVLPQFAVQPTPVQSTSVQQTPVQPTYIQPIEAPIIPPAYAQPSSALEQSAAPLAVSDDEIMEPDFDIDDTDFGGDAFDESEEDAFVL